jgi:hypothetical protein
MAASPASTGPGPTFKGSFFARGRYVFRYQGSGTAITLGSFKPDAAEAGARLYDAVLLLLHGPHADTNFEWNRYTRADVAAAALFLEAKGVDVKQAILSARNARGITCNWIGVCHTAGSTRTWRARTSGQRGENGGLSVRVEWDGMPSAEAAAHQADCGFLAVRGVGCITNFPASTYSQQQLEVAGDYAISKGAMSAARVEENLAAIQQVRGL